MVLIAVVFGAFGLSGAGGVYFYEKSKQADPSHEWKPIGRCQWDIGGVPIDFEKVAQFKIVPGKKDRVVYNFIMNDGYVRREAVGSNFGINGTINELRACTQGRALGLSTSF